jgi:hypothetical protein
MLDEITMESQFVANEVSFEKLLKVMGFRGVSKIVKSAGVCGYQLFLCFWVVK